MRNAKMRYLIVAMALLLGPTMSARAQFSVNIGGAGFNIGINMPVYPHLVRIPGYPVYYDPDVNSNYFFYDGLYWVFSGDNWYASSWYNGPWDLVPPEAVPQFVLLVPVRYYRAPPVYFRTWYRDGPPRWGEHWGRSWEQHRAGWDRWDRRSAPAPAPLPVYQRQYSGNQYPRAIQQQQVIQSQNYRYQPRDAVAQQHFQQRAVQSQTQGTPGPTRGQATPPVKQASPQNDQRIRTDRQVQQQQQHPTPSPQPAYAGRPHPAQPAGPAAQTQNASQDRIRGNAGSPQAKSAETKVAPHQNQPAVQASGAPQAKGGNNGPQARAAESRGGHEEAKGGDQGKGAREGKVKEDKKE